MGLTMNEKKAVIREVAKRYQGSSKKKKMALLDEYVHLTGYHRSYGSYLLRNYGRKVLLRIKGKLIQIVFGESRPRVKRRRKKIYDEKVLKALKPIWLISDCLCGKRLAPFLGELLAKLEQFKEIKLEEEVREKLLQISAATIDRLLKEERKKYELKGKARTKPGTLLKHQIPVRTYKEWNEKLPGFVEIDLVGHDGGDPSGDFLQTLDVTDVLTGWTETRAIRNKAQRWVFEALLRIKSQLPFALLGIDSDNGSEFINHHLFRYCRDNQITFTRSRRDRQNDNCFVEQKNYSVVRRTVGYQRYDTLEELRLLNELYDHLRLYTNFFQPLMKLVDKVKLGSKTRKKYDTPTTPFRRVLLSPQIGEDKKERLLNLYEELNPAELKRKILKLQNRLAKLNQLKETIRRRSLIDNKSKSILNQVQDKDLVYIY